MMRYDAKIGDRFATMCYDRARSIVIAWTLLFLLIGAVAGFVLGNAYRRDLHRLLGEDSILISVCAAGALLGVIGYLIGQGKAFWWKLQAQILLCQQQIEQNTRVETKVSLTS